MQKQMWRTYATEIPVTAPNMLCRQNATAQAPYGAAGLARYDNTATGPIISIQQTPDGPTVANMSCFTHPGLPRGIITYWTPPGWAPAGWMWIQCYEQAPPIAFADLEPTPIITAVGRGSLEIEMPKGATYYRVCMVAIQAITFAVTATEQFVVISNT